MNLINILLYDRRLCMKWIRIFLEKRLVSNILSMEKARYFNTSDFIDGKDSDDSFLTNIATCV